MRVDNGAGGTDALARLKVHLSALRRRWYVVVVPAVLGAVLGWVSAPDTSASLAPRTEYFQASHVLILDQAANTGNSRGTVNLNQAAYLVNTGEIPARVAETLDLAEADVRSSIIGLPRQQVESVEVQAVGTSSDEVVALADEAAAELLAILEADAIAAADAEAQRVLTTLDDLENQLSELNDQIADNPPNRSQLEAQQRSLTNQYSLTYEQFSQMANRPPPTAGLISLEGATASTLSEDEYDAMRDTIREGAAYVTGTPTTAPSSRGSSDAGPAAGAPTRAAVGGLVGLAVGIGMSLTLDRFDNRLRRREDVESATGLTVVAEIPPLSRHQQRSHEVVAYTQHRSRAAEAYRVVRGALLFVFGVDRSDEIAGSGAKVVMVTSANPAEGKTTTVANLAAVLAEGGFNVLVINCDFRRPKVHQYLLEARRSPADGAGQARLVARRTMIERVRLISGIGEDDPDANPLEVLALQRQVIQAARERFDIVLLDTAPFLTTNDASELLAETDQVLLVVRAGKTTLEAAARTAEVLGRFDAPVIGIVMNDSDDSPAAQYYYGYVTEKSGKRRRGGGSRGADRSDTARPTTEELNGQHSRDADRSRGAAPTDSPADPTRT